MINGIIFNIHQYKTISQAWLSAPNIRERNEREQTLLGSYSSQLIIPNRSEGSRTVDLGCDQISAAKSRFLCLLIRPPRRL